MASNFDIAALAITARRNGFAVATARPLDIAFLPTPTNWRKLPIRKGDPAVSILRPTSPQAAKPRSLSATTGLGAQPMHTDGAHFRVPPDIVLLYAEHPSTTPTMLLRNPLRDSPTYDGTAGVFLVNGGDDRFLATAYDYGHGLRFDSGCMTPQDQRARQIARVIADAEARAEEHIWSQPNAVLIIDNTAVLHGRAAVATGDEDRALVRVAFNTKGAS
ncbi:TauD/TfdA family dioxygenase [Nocardia nova]|jgi:hypothetical protein|uniref:TauD/TfdA family dioxygenase n=1 Tax=Nocardia nova TaxID=37330 RepID=UPI0012E7F202|nr:TauD/TfdA family dioxygenase [Nocardia nova]